MVGDKRVQAEKAGIQRDRFQSAGGKKSAA